MAHHEQDDMTVRQIPGAHWSAIGWLVLLLVIVATAAWEWRMRSLGLRAGDLDDSKANWAVERRRIDSGDHQGVAILGSSRILFDTDLEVWRLMTGRRPVQLALAGMSGLPFLEDLAVNTEFNGLVVIDITESFFRERGRVNPDFAGVLDYWKKQGPAERFGHKAGQFLSRHLAFLDDQYALAKLIEQVDIPNRGVIVDPYLAVWKLSETYDERQTCLWREIEINDRLRDHAIRVWLSRNLPPPSDDEVARVIGRARKATERIHERGGEVVFVRAPSRGAYYERELRNMPRARTWDRLLHETGAFGMHFDDYPEMQALELPEMSHLSRESATRFTRAYVGVLRERYFELQ
jgi:hypothetical protein